jgi:hypothetical protein
MVVFVLKKPKSAGHKHHGTSTHGQSTRTEKRVFYKTYYKTQGPQRGVEPSFKFSAVSDGGENHIPREA